MWGLCIWGVRIAWRTESDGDFYCPGCGGDRGYRRRGGVRKLTVLGVPLLSRGVTGSVVECTACRTRYGLEALERPTSTRLSAMLRDAVYMVALAVLAAGGAEDGRARRAATAAIRDAGGADRTEEQLTAALASLPHPADDGLGDHLIDGCGSALSIELHETLEPLADHLAAEGRARILLLGARIALADGAYIPAERAVLSAVGRCLLMSETATAQVLDTAPH